MSIYPDKKNGQLTGRFRVELQRKGFKTYKKRWDTLAEAQADEKAVLASWDAGEAVAAPGLAPGAPGAVAAHTLASTIPMAKGLLWEGTSTEELSWQRIEIIADLMGRNTRLDDITNLKIDDLLKKLLAKGISKGTINRYMSHLSVFLTWARQRDLRTKTLKGEGGLTFPYYEEEEGRLRVISYEEERAIGEYLLSRGRPEADAVWDVIQVALQTGCRRDELLTATLGQIKGDLLQLEGKKTKTKKTRMVPLTPESVTRLRSLIVQKRLPTQRGLRSWWERARAHMGLTDDPEFVFHACRHTCATRMVDADVNVYVIKEWLGHTCIETTLRYAKMKPSNLLIAREKVGEHLRLVGQNPQISFIPASPFASPMGGAIDDLEQAA